MLVATLHMTYYCNSIVVFNGDTSYIDGHDKLSSSTRNFTYQPLIPRTNLIITFTAVFVREINGSSTINATIKGNETGMHSCITYIVGKFGEGKFDKFGMICQTNTTHQNN